MDWVEGGKREKKWDNCNRISNKKIKCIILKMNKRIKDYIQMFIIKVKCPLS